MILLPRASSGRILVGAYPRSGYDHFGYDYTGALPVDVESVLGETSFAKTTGPSSAGSPSGATRLENALEIVKTALSEGLPLGIALAMVVNADAESGLNHLAVGDGGHAIGLFQANDLGGKRTFPGDRRDPESTTRWIISEYRAAYSRTLGKDLSKGGVSVTRPSLSEAITSGRSVADLAGLFAFHVERPYDLQGAETARRSKTFSMFPSWVASAPVNSLEPLSGLPARVREVPMYILPEPLYHGIQ